MATSSYTEIAIHIIDFTTFSASAHHQLFHLNNQHY